MTAVKTYLLRLILCGFFVTLCAAILKGRKGSRALALCGGCLLILTALRPLLQVDLKQLPDLITGLTRPERQEAAREKNEALLRALVEEQTADWIETRARETGLTLKAEVTARDSGDGIFIPWIVSLTGTWTPAQREAFAGILTDELAVPPERQRWVGG